MYKVIKKCLLCNYKLTPVLALGTTPLANEIPKDWSQDLEKFPLNLMKCVHCHHLQIDTIVDKERLYKYYVYTSNTSESNRKHFESYADEMLKLYRKPFVVDIGSNDGLFLSYFKKRGCKVLGVDPAVNIAKIAQGNGIPTLTSFFDSTTALSIEKDNGKADLITCNNAFAHNADLTPIVYGVKQLLSNNGTFVFEVSYAMDLLANNLFDLVYHEHIHHWHIRPMIRFFAKHNLSVVDVKRIKTHGGSIRVFVRHRANITKSPIPDILMKEEAEFDDLLFRFQNKVVDIKKELMETLFKLKNEGKTISILGYPAKAATLCSYFGLNNEIITDVFDDNPLKIGKFSHQGIQILPTIQMHNKIPDYLLILSWNYAYELMETHKLFRSYGGKFIIPLPQIRIR